MVDNKKQWFILIFLSIWLLAAITFPIVAYCVTRNAVCLTFYSTLALPILILYRIIKHLFPLSENDTKIALAKQQKKR